MSQPLNKATCLDFPAVGGGVTEVWGLELGSAAERFGLGFEKSCWRVCGFETMIRDVVAVSVVSLTY